MEGRPVNRPLRARPLLPAPLGLLGVLALLAGALPLRGDEITLTHGGVLVGRIVGENEREFIIEVPYGRMTIPRREVSSIVREGEAEYLRDASERILRTGDVLRALDLLRRACALAPEDGARRAELVSALGRGAETWIAARRLEEAEALLDERRSLAGDSPEDAVRRERIRTLRAGRSERERRAIEAWEAGSHETAHRLWAELRAENPHSAERWREPLAAAALRLGHDALLGRRLDAARARYLECLELDPDRLPEVREPFALCEVERLRPLLERGRLDEADRQLLAALEVLPDEPALVFHRALVAEARGDTRAAGRLYAKLAGERHRPIEGQTYLEELRRRAASRVERGVALVFREKSSTTTRGSTPAELSETIRGGPFVLHFAAGFDAEEVLVALERQLARFEEEWFGGQPALPADLEVSVHLHPSREALLAAENAPLLPECDGFVRTERRYGVLLRQEMHLNAGAVRLTSAVVPHELAHLLIPYRLGRGIALPAWLEEGIACSEEPELLRRHRHRTIADARRAREEIPLGELVSASAVPTERPALFYAASASVVEFLRERLGLHELLGFAKRAALSGIEPALSECAGYDTVADLELAWRSWLDDR